MPRTISGNVRFVELDYRIRGSFFQIKQTLTLIISDKCSFLGSIVIEDRIALGPWQSFYFLILGAFSLSLSLLLFFFRFAF